MADVVFRAALGKGRHLHDQAKAGTGVLAAVILKTVEADATLRTRATLAEVLAAAGTAEADWTGGTAYARKTTVPANLTLTSASQVDADIDDLTWLNAGVSTSPQQLAKLLIVYFPTATITTAQNANAIPITAHDYLEIANGADITATIAASGYYRAAG